MADKKVDVGAFPKVMTPGADDYGQLVSTAMRYVEEPTQSQTWLTADNMERYSDRWMRDQFAGSPLSLADRMAGDYNVLVDRGRMTPDGQAIPNLLTSAEQEYFGSGGEQGSWGSVNLPTAASVPGRGAAYYRPDESEASKAAWLATNAPAAYKAIIDAGMNPDDVATVHNVFIARLAADQIIKYAGAGEFTVALQLINVMPNKQRIMTAAFVDSEMQKQQAEAEQVQAEQTEENRQQALSPRFDPATGQVVTPGVNPAGQVTTAQMATPSDLDVNAFGRLIDALLIPVETSIHAARAVGLTFQRTDGDPSLMLTPIGGAVPDTSNPIAMLGALWEATSEDFISQDSYNDLTDKFGAKDTDLMIRYYTAARSESEDAMPQFWASIDDDQYAKAYITSAMRGENVGGSEDAAELFVAVAAADQGNLGNLAGAAVGLSPDSAPFKITRDATNVASWFLLDPTLYAGRAFKALNVARYGLDSALARTGGSISRLIRENAGTNRMYEQFGASLKQMKETKDPFVREAMLADHTKRFSGPEARFFNQVHTEIGLERGLFTAEDWATYYGQIDDAQRLSQGGAVSVKTQVKNDPSKSGMDFLGQYSPEARTEVAMAAGVATGVNTPAVRGASRLFLEHVAAQSGNRNLYVPHMSAAKAWAADHARWLSSNSDKTSSIASRAFEQVLGPEWRNAPMQQQVDVLVSALNDPEMASSLGYALSDFKAMSVGGQRTFAGRLMDSIFRGDSGKSVGWTRIERDAAGNERIVQQKGWSRRRFWNGGAGFSESFVRTRDQWGRLLTRLPDVRRGIVVNTAKDADKVYEMAVAAGVGKEAAGLVRLMWVEANTAQRQNLMIGLTRTFLKASGVHAVDPKAEEEILGMMTGIRSGELHAPDQIRRLGGVWSDINTAAQTTHKQLVTAAQEAATNSPTAVILRSAQQDLKDLRANGAAPEEVASAAARVKAASKVDRQARRLAPRVPTVASVRSEMLAEARKPGGALEAGRYNPSIGPGKKSSALYMAQTEDRMGVINFQKMDRYTARTSMLNALLMNNKGGQLVTDMWVLGTLYGPRFQLRNGIEDIGMYALTGGRVSAVVRGRRVSQAIDGAVARESTDYAAKKGAVEKAQRDLDTATRQRDTGRAGAADVEKAEAKLDEARKSFQMARNKYGRHAKLGIVRTALVGMSERATYRSGEHVRDGLISRVAQFLVPTTSRVERRDAAEAGREAVADLAAKAVLRQKLVFGGSREAKDFYLRVRRANSIEDLSPADQQILRFEDELLRSEWGYQFKDDAAETTMHLSDSTLPTTGDMHDLTYLDGELYRKAWFDRGYETEYAVGKNLNEPQSRAMMAHLRFMVDKYTLNQVALEELPAYWRALNRPGGSDQALLDDVVERVLQSSRRGKDWPLVRERFRLVDDLSERDLVQRMLDDMSNAFTGREGTWNNDLYTVLRRTDDKGMPYFTLGDDAEDLAVHEVDFLAGKFDHPESLLVLRGEPALVPERRNINQLISAATWEPMGRSLARMTRNPIWYGNYLEARQQMSSLESAYASIFGQATASKMMTEAAAERAYNITMSYVDNPAVRTNLAWQVRNIARYYRAQEDFARRMMRMAKYEPLGYWKATLAWQASQDVGFVHKDQYGDEYFVYPFSAPAIAAFQNVSNGLGITNAKYGIAPMAFGGKVQWLSPSMDPGQWLPTLSSPWTAVTLQPLMRSMPVAQDFFKELERAAFGDISADSYVKTSFDGPAGNMVAGLLAAMPPNFKKLQALAASALQGDAPGTFGYRMGMKTMMAIAASGNMPTPAEWAGDENVRDEFIADMQMRTIEMSALSLVFGLFAPSSPQYMDDYVSLAAREAGYEMLRPAFRQMINASIENGKTWDEAYVSWMTSHPDQGIFAVSMTAGANNGYVQPTLANVEYLKENQDVWEAAPRGLVLFMPDGKTTADDDLKALQALRMYNAAEWKSLEDIGTELATVRSYVAYKQLNLAIDNGEVQITKTDANGETTQEWRDHEEAATLARQELRARNNGLAFRMYSRGRTTSDEWQGDAEDVVAAARTLAKRGNVAAEATLPLVDAYRSFSIDYRNLMKSISSSADPDADKTHAKDVWEEIVAQWIASEPKVSDEQRDTLIMTFTLALNDSWEVVY